MSGPIWPNKGVMLLCNALSEDSAFIKWENEAGTFQNESEELDEIPKNSYRRRIRHSGK